VFGCGADDHALGLAGVGGPDDPAIAGGGRHAGHDVHPGRVAISPDQGCLAAGRVGREDAHVVLVAAEHDDERRGGTAPFPFVNAVIPACGD
jgi:hypothetical protein